MNALISDHKYKSIIAQKRCKRKNSKKQSKKRIEKQKKTTYAKDR